MLRIATKKSNITDALRTLLCFGNKYYNKQRRSDTSVYNDPGSRICLPSLNLQKSKKDVVSFVVEFNSDLSTRPTLYSEKNRHLD